VAARFRFGEFDLDLETYRLHGPSGEVVLTPKAFELLTHFVRRPQVLLSKDDLFREIWPEVIVTDNALTQVVSELRQALGDAASDPRFIQTVARKGYRFVAAVASVDGADPSTPRPSASREHASTVAVLDFVDLSVGGDHQWLSTGFVESVMTDLSALGLRVVDRPRLRQAADAAGDACAAARLLGVDLVTTGSVQGAGGRLRVTVRIADAASGEVRADARADGPAQDVFAMQDALGRELASALGHARGTKSARRQTSSLEAYRTAIDGRVLLESLDADAIPRAIERFTQALALDPAYAPAQVGLANARCWLYEGSRSSPAPRTDLLAQAVRDARRGVALDEGYAEAHATLAYVLACSGERGEARTEAQRAIALEPLEWSHWFRLAHATWGRERLDALQRTLAAYPEFAFAALEKAMVHVAAGAFDTADAVLSRALALERGSGGSPRRFPAGGLAWLSGLLALARGDADVALAAFDAEAVPAGHIYALEFATAANWGRGFALMASRRMDEAERAFVAAVPHDGSGHAALGLAAVHTVTGDHGRAKHALAAVDRLALAHRAAGRTGHAILIDAGALIARDEHDRGCAQLARALDAAPPGSFGWLLPIDPVFSPASGADGWRRVLEAVARRSE
jgi:DNA-binding winged helix-turn-helix (wHTH) protein/tetratricopeptide (TPR) repeat protein